MTGQPPKQAVNLLIALFTEGELSIGNCTKPKRGDIAVLDLIKLSAIRGIQIMYSI